MMEIFSDTNLLIGNGISLVGAIFLAISCFVHDRKTVFWYQAINCFLLAAASYFFGSFAGITTLVICGIRNIIIAYDRYSKKIMFITLALAIVSGLLANNRGWIGLLPILATVEYTVCCHFIRSASGTRWSILVNEIIWISYAFLIMDVSTVISESAIIIADLISIIKNRKTEG